LQPEVGTVNQGIIAQADLIFGSGGNAGDWIRGIIAAVTIAAVLWATVAFA